MLSIAAVSHDSSEREAWTRGAQNWVAEAGRGPENPAGKFGRVTPWGPQSHSFVETAVAFLVS